MPIETILIVDDEPLMRSFLEKALSKSYDVSIASGGKEALKYFKEKEYDLVITDMRMPDMNGLELLKKIKEHAQKTAVIVMTAYGTVETAVEAMKCGAFNYILKPFSPDALEVVIAKAQEHVKLAYENTFLREEINHERLSSTMIAESPIMKKVLEEAIRVAKTNASVLVHGESGTGKEVIAGALHAHSLRAHHPYIRVNCAAVPDTLIESEFFGHEKGSFTGAHTKRLGRFELAHKGTLLLDEVTEIPITLQPKLLRVIQEQEFERVGGARAQKVDVRLISTSNRDLKEAIDAKIFREDLYYRLNVVPLHLPPLRERKDDILPLARFFLESACKENRKKKKAFSKEAEKALLNYPWPGNIRELSNVMQRVVALDFSQKIEKEHLLLQ